MQSKNWQKVLAVGKTLAHFTVIEDCSGGNNSPS